jgi:hypothetical protein
MNGTAEFSECQRFRYTLTRTWGIEQKLCVVGLNPSTATADVNDRTIRRCMDYAKRWGHGGLLMLNLFAYRTAFPSEMWEARARGVDIIGVSATTMTRCGVTSSNTAARLCWQHGEGTAGNAGALPCVNSPACIIWP